MSINLILLAGLVTVSALRVLVVRAVDNQIDRQRASRLKLVMRKSTGHRSPIFSACRVSPQGSAALGWKTRSENQHLHENQAHSGRKGWA